MSDDVSPKNLEDKALEFYNKLSEDERNHLEFVDNAFDVDRKTANEFLELHKGGATSKEIFELFPNLFPARYNRSLWNYILYKIQNKLCIDRSKWKKAHRARLARHEDQVKAQISTGTNPKEPPTIVPVMAPGGSLVPVVDVAAHRKYSLNQAFRDAVTYDDMVEIVGVLVTKAKAGEPWAMVEILNRAYGKPKEGMLAQQVQNEIAGAIDWSKISLEQLSVLADIARRVDGQSPAIPDQQGTFVSQPEEVLGAGGDRLPPGSQTIQGSCRPMAMGSPESDPPSD